MTDENPYESPTTDNRVKDDATAKGGVLSSLSEFVRTIARASSFSAFAITLVGFLAYPRPWGSHWTTRKTITFVIINYGGLGALFCLLICLIACCLIPWARTAKKRPLWPAFTVNVASIIMTILTPMS